MSSSEYWKSLTDRCVGEGLCVRCRKRPAVDGGRKCAECNEYQSNYMKGRRKGWKTEGACYRCGKPMDDDSKTNCINCQIDNNRRKEIARSWV